MTLDDDVMKNAEGTSALVLKTAEDIAGRVTKELDDYMDKIRPLIFAERDRDYISNAELEQVIMKIPMMLYWVSSNKEKFATKEDVARRLREIKKYYNYVNAQGKVTDKKIASEQDTDAEYLVELCFKTASAIMREKVAYASELLQSAKRAISRRMNDGAF